MRIVTWNINSIRIRIDLLQELVNKFQPDVIALQETKVIDKDFPLSACLALGFNYIRFSGEASYNGVAILSKIPITSHFSLEFYNSHKRHLAVVIAGIEIHNFYVPAGGDIADSSVNGKFLHKLEFVDLMYNWFRNHRCTKQKIILLGDLNIAPFEHDVWSSNSLKNTVSHTKIERDKLLRNMSEFNWLDAPRYFIPLEQKLYSWWSYRNVDWQRSNRGRRLDHIWLSQGLKNYLKAHHTFRDMRHYNKTSDHVPVIVDIDYCMK